jgi:hypothetical protein
VFSEMTKIRQFLADELATRLQEVDNRYTVEQRLRYATLNSRSRGDRIAIMGKDTTYAEVQYIGRASSGQDYVTTGKPTLRDYQFRVTVWYGYKDSDAFADSSQPVFDEICEVAVLPYFEQLAMVTDADTFQLVGNPENITISFDYLSNEIADLAHVLTFTIFVRDEI